MPCCLLLDPLGAADDLIDPIEHLHQLGWHVLRASTPQALHAGLQFDCAWLYLPREAMMGTRWQTWLHALQTLPTLVMMDPPDPLERILALEMGADAVMLAPHLPSEAVARVQGLVRRSQTRLGAPQEADLLRDWLRSSVDSGQFSLSASERLVFKALLEEPDRVMSRAELLHRTGLGAQGRQPNVVDLAVSRLRQKLQGQGTWVDAIRTMRGRGYVWATDALPAA